METNLRGSSLQRGVQRLLKKLFIIVFVVPLTVTAQTTVQYEDVKLLASDGTEEDFFGADVSVFENIAAMGARRADGVAPETGAVYVFELQPDETWLQTDKLFALDGVADDRFFGYTLAVSGGTMVVGGPARYFDDYKGSAYIFERQADATWVQAQKLLASDAESYDNFGYDVNLSGDVAVMGAGGEDDYPGGSIMVGAAYIFVRQPDGSWQETAKLKASDSAADEYFGNAVAVSGDIALIGTRGAANGYRSGSAYVFERQPDGTWIETAKLLASDGAPEDEFGSEGLSIFGETAAIGAINDDDQGTDSGSVYIYERQPDGSWPETAKLLASDGAEGHQFGHGLAISGGRIVVGAVRDDDYGDSSGSAYVFERQGDGSWLETAKLLASDGAESDRYGLRVALYGQTALTGAFTDDDNGIDSGSAYLYSVGQAQEGCDPIVNPPALDFGTVTIGNTITLSASLINNGTESCNTAATVDSSSGEFLLISTPTFEVAAGESAEIEVDYSPVDLGDDVGTLGLFIAELADPIGVPLSGSGAEAPFDLDIARFRVTKNVRFTRVRPISINLTVSNEGTGEGTAPATVTGVQNGEEVYRRTLVVTDDPGGAPQTFTFDTYLPVETGLIDWTVTIDDANPDFETATTNVW